MMATPHGEGLETISKPVDWAPSIPIKRGSSGLADLLFALVSFEGEDLDFAEFGGMGFRLDGDVS